MLFKTFALILCLFIINSVDAREVKSKSCTNEKLIPDLEFDVVGEALTIVKNNPPSVARSATVGPYTVWVRADCHSASDCFTCVSELADKVWGFCDNAKGAHIFYGECSLRYEFYPF